MIYPAHISMKKPYVTFLGLIINGLNKTGIQAFLYYVFEEELSDDPPPDFESSFDGYQTDYLGPKAMKAISSTAIPERKESEEYLLQRLKRGSRCLGIKHQNRIVSFSWYDLRECNFGNLILPLKEDEACIFDAYTLKSCRGKGMAPFVRHQLYKELLILERKKLLSASDFFNVPAIRFKRKLNAKLLELRINIKCYRLFLSLRLKKYPRTVSRLKLLYLVIRVKKGVSISF